jgi:glycosyltransferase involved in cell wall biosynthesis
MQNETLISFIIPLYNCGKYIARCIRSIEEQNIDSYEVIVVDDGSTDGGGDIVAEMQSHNPHIKLIRQKNASCGYARNTALDVATGKYIYFVDADDIMVKNSVMPVIDEMERLDIDAMRIVNDCVHDEESAVDKANTCNDESSLHTSDVVSGIQYLKETRLLKDYAVNVWKYIYKREPIAENGLKFVNFSAEDHVFNLEFMMIAKRVARCNQRTYVWIVYPNSVSHFHYSYDYYSKFGHNWLCTVERWQQQWNDVLKEHDMLELVSAYKAALIFELLLWPQVRDCLSPIRAWKANKKLKREKLFPIAKENQCVAGFDYEQKALHWLWLLARHYHLWMVLVFFNWLLRSKFRNDAHRQVVR